MWNNIKSFVKSKYYTSNFYNKLVVKNQMSDFAERLIAIIKFQKYIKDQTSFALEEKIYIDANNSHLNDLRKDINAFLDQYEL